MSEGRELGLDISYELLDLDYQPEKETALPRLLSMAEKEGFSGVNVTYPCKQTVIEHLSRLSADAKALGAVNTVVFRNGERFGHNTDWFGFAESVSRFLPKAPLGRVLLLGAGGAGAGVAYALLKRGAGTLVVHDIDLGRRDDLIKRLSGSFEPQRLASCGDVIVEMGRCDGVVNCTPIGMKEYQGTPAPIELLRETMWVGEIVYFPIETEFLKAARARGCATLDGGGMAVFQAAAAFHLFTGHEPDSDRMLRKFREDVSLAA